MAKMDAPAEENQARALELHLAGATYETIAKAIGYSNRSGAHKAVQAALSDLGRYSVDDDVIETELARLDAMLTGLWPKARRGDVQAIDRVLKIGERRSLLLTASTRNDPVKEGTALDELAARRRTAGRPDASGVDVAEVSGQ